MLVVAGCMSDPAVGLAAAAMRLYCDAFDPAVHAAPLERLIARAVEADLGTSDEREAAAAASVHILVRHGHDPGPRTHTSKHVPLHGLFTHIFYTWPYKQAWPWPS